jgi:hypothetical protein
MSAIQLAVQSDDEAIHTLALTIVCASGQVHLDYCLLNGRLEDARHVLEVLLGLVILDKVSGITILHLYTSKYVLSYSYARACRTTP